MSEQHPSVPQVCLNCTHRCPLERVFICELNVCSTLCYLCKESELDDPIDKLNGAKACSRTCVKRAKQNREACDK